MIYKRGKGKKKWYWMDDTVNGIRYQESLKTQNWQQALQNERDRLLEISQGKAGARGPTAKQALGAALDAYIDERQLHSAEKSCRTDKERSQALRKALGELPLKKITAQSILAYQKARIEAGISGRTVNLEIGLLRRVLKKSKQWSRIADDVRMLPERPKEARVLTQEEKQGLLEIARTKDDWQVAYLAAVLALNTTCRSCELRGLRWKDVDWTAMTITIRRQSTKTNAGARVIPLNPDALVALMELRDRADKLDRREAEKRGEQQAETKESRPAEHFVLPSCENGRFDATKPMKDWRSAWRSLTRAVACPNCGTLQRPSAVCKNEDCRAGIEGVKSPFYGLRFHDLRHQAVTELAERGLSDQTIMAVAGHVSREMLNHYSHIRLEAKRQALAGLSNRTLASVTLQSTLQNEKPAEAGSASYSF
jgi:integrase